MIETCFCKEGARQHGLWSYIQVIAYYCFLYVCNIQMNSYFVACHIMFGNTEKQFPWVHSYQQNKKYSLGLGLKQKMSSLRIKIGQVLTPKQSWPRPVKNEVLEIEITIDQHILKQMYIVRLAAASLPPTVWYCFFWYLLVIFFFFFEQRLFYYLLSMLLGRQNLTYLFVFLNCWSVSVRAQHLILT